MSALVSIIVGQFGALFLQMLSVFYVLCLTEVSKFHGFFGGVTPSHIPVWEGHHHSQFLPLSGWGRSFWSRPVDPDRQKEPFGGDYIAILHGLHGLSEWWECG